MIAQIEQERSCFLAYEHESLRAVPDYTAAFGSADGDMVEMDEVGFCLIVLYLFAEPGFFVLLPIFYEYNGIGAQVDAFLRAVCAREN